MGAQTPRATDAGEPAAASDILGAVLRCRCPRIDSGQRIGRYQPIRRLAVGGMAEIFLARLPGVGIEGFEKLVVLKRILPQHALDPELLRMFLDEARLSATLTHPHVIEVYDVGADGDAPFFAMEYVHGANVREMLRAQGRAARQRRRAARRCRSRTRSTIVAAAAAGLHYAHERLGPGGEPLGIVHRDVSPVERARLVRRRGQGLRLRHREVGVPADAHPGGDAEGKVRVHVARAVPRRGRSTARSDIFALGAILYELTTGTAPFAGASELDILNQIATGRAAPPAWPEAMGAYPPALAEIVMRALAPDADDRFPTMQAFQIALEAFARAARTSRCRRWRWRRSSRSCSPTSSRRGSAAQRAGKSLGEHLAAKPAVVASADPADRTATDGFATANRRAKAAGARPARRGDRRVRRAVRGRRRATADEAPESGAEITPPPAAPGAEMNPATDTTAEKACRSGASSLLARPRPRPRRCSNTKTKARVKPAVIRQGRAGAAGETAAGPRPNADSRLGSWDPDSPVPP